MYKHEILFLKFILGYLLIFFLSSYISLLSYTCYKTKYFFFKLNFSKNLSTNQLLQLISRLMNCKICFLVSKSCQQVLAPANQYLKEQEAKQGSGEIDLNNPLAKPRIPYEILFAIGGWSAGSPTNFVETYDTRCSIPSSNRKHGFR